MSLPPLCELYRCLLVLNTPKLIEGVNVEPLTLVCLFCVQKAINTAEWQEKWGVYCKAENNRGGQLSLNSWAPWVRLGVKVLTDWSWTGRYVSDHVQAPGRSPVLEALLRQSVFLGPWQSVDDGRVGHGQVVVTVCSGPGVPVSLRTRLDSKMLSLEMNDLMSLMIKVL